MPQTQKRRNFLMPDSNMGQANMGQMGQMDHAPDMSAETPHAHASPSMDWKSYLPNISQGFQQGGLLGAGMEGLGLWLKNRKRS